MSYLECRLFFIDFTVACALAMRFSMLIGLNRLENVWGSAVLMDSRGRISQSTTDLAYFSGHNVKSSIAKANANVTATMTDQDLSGMKSEYRLPLLIWASFLIPIGVLL